MMLSCKLRTDTAAVESAEALEQVNAADVDVARQVDVASVLLMLYCRLSLMERLEASPLLLHML